MTELTAITVYLVEGLLANEEYHHVLQHDPKQGDVDGDDGADRKDDRADDADDRQPTEDE